MVTLAAFEDQFGGRGDRIGDETLEAVQSSCGEEGLGSDMKINTVQ